jgi:hypothetical protein
VPLCLILVMLAVPLLAQPVSPANATEQAAVAALLSSSDAGQLAWGAQLAANYQQKTFVPAIISLLDFANHDVQLSAFDALIRLNADVPELNLARFLNDPDALEPTIVLLARDPKAHADFLMSALDQPVSDPHWIAVNSFLAAAPPRSYASRLLRAWTIKATIIAREDALGEDDDGAGGECGDGGTMLRPGFPMIPRYHIYEGLHPGATLIASGPHPISYMRQTSFGDCRSSLDRDTYRLDYLRYMAHVDEPLPDPPAIRWAGTEDYLSKTSAYLDSLRAFITNLRAGLVQAGVLAESDGLDGPTLEIEVKDERLNRTVPLPVVDWRLQP